MLSQQQVTERSMASEEQGRDPGSPSFSERKEKWARTFFMLMEKRTEGFLSRVEKRYESSDQQKLPPMHHDDTKMVKRSSRLKVTRSCELPILEMERLLGEESEPELDYASGDKIDYANLQNEKLRFHFNIAMRDLQRSKNKVRELQKRVTYLEEENDHLAFENQQLYQRCLLNSFLNEPYPLEHLPFLCAMDDQITEGPFSAGGYDLIETLGGGSLGTVYSGRNAMQEEYAIKKIGKNQLNRYDKIEQLHLEVKALCSNRHHNIISLKETFHGRNAVYLVFEKAWIDVHSYSELGPISVPVLREIMFGLFQALEFIHGRSYAHMDVKPDNILLTVPRSKGKITAQNVRLCDFGLCVHGDGSGQGSVFQEGGRFIGTRNFFAPELAFSDIYDAALADMWSSGATLFEMANGGFSPSWEKAYDVALENKTDDGCSFESLIFKYVDQKRCADVPQSLMVDLMINGLLVRPNERYRSSEVADHPWFSDLLRRPRS